MLFFVKFIETTIINFDKNQKEIFWHSAGNKTSLTNFRYGLAFFLPFINLMGEQNIFSPVFDLTCEKI
jgi:hypothetical protein